MYDELVKVLRETDFSDGCPCGAEPLCKEKDCVILQAACAIEELSKPKWIPVTERLPENEMKLNVPASDVRSVHITNGDRIRAMSDEELAVLIGDNIDCAVCREMHDSDYCPKPYPGTCYDCWLDWLRQEAKE